MPPPPGSTLFPYTTLFRSDARRRSEISRSLASHTASTTAARLVKVRSEEHTSELQSRENLVCRLLLEKKKRCDRAHLRALALIAIAAGAEDGDQPTLDVRP